MNTINDYIQRGHIDSIVNLTFSSGGSTPIILKVKDVYQEGEKQMARLHGFMGDAEFNLGVVDIKDTQNCERVYV